MQVAALHRALGRLYVPMHRGGEGSHKDGGTEIWVFDYNKHTRLARWPLQAKDVGASIAVQVSQDDHPIVYAATEKSNVLVIDALTGKLRHVERALGQTPWMILTPDTRGAP